MGRTTITISSDLFDETDQQASVRENLPIRTLLADCRREFSLPEGNYILTDKDTGRPLDPDKTLEQLGIQTGAKLILTSERWGRQPAPRGVDPQKASTAVREGISGPNRAFFREESTGQIFDILWQPALIGRPDAASPDSAAALAVNLGTFQGGQAVSRSHARVTEQDGQYYIEALTERNPTYLNDAIIRPGERRPLQHGDRVRVARFSLVFGVK